MLYNLHRQSLVIAVQTLIVNPLVWQLKQTLVSDNFPGIRASLYTSSVNNSGTIY